MSLEAALDRNTAAINRLYEQLSGAKLHSATPAKGEDKPTPPATEKPAAPAGDAKALDFDKDVKPLALKLLAKNKAALADICKAHGVAKISEVKDAAKYPALVAELNKALA